MVIDTSAVLAWLKNEAERERIVAALEHYTTCRISAVSVLEAHIVVRAREHPDMIDKFHQEAYSLDGACTNQAESYFSRLRRSEIGHHHHVAGPYLLRYAQESAWREDNRRVPNGDQVHRIAALALTRKPSVDFSGYWQRHVSK